MRRETRKFASLAIGIALGLLGWWAGTSFLASSDASRHDASGANAAKPARSNDSKGAPPLAPAQKAAKSGAPASRESESVAPVAAVPAPAAPKLHGTIVGVDEAGVEHPELDGSFTLRWLEQKQVRSAEVKVARGKFATDAPPVDALVVDDVILGQRIGRLADPEVDIPKSGEVALRVTLTPASTLRVLDAATRAELDAVDVSLDLEPMRGPNRLAPRSEEEVARDEAAGAHDGSAGGTSPVVTHARSPVVLPAIDGTPNYWVHVKGYAWTLLQVQQQLGGEREVPLTAGGTLSIRFLQKPEREDLELVVRNGTANRSFRAAIVDAARDLADVAAGHCEVEATIAAAAGSDQERTVVAHAECDVVAGATAHVELALGDVPSTPKVARVPFRGVVVGADARLTMELFARLSALDPAQRVAGPDRFKTRPVVRDPTRAGTWTFDFGTIVPGRKLVTIEPLQVHRVVEVRPEGLTDARIELPAFGEVEVTVTDAQTGAAIPSAGVSWRSAKHPMADDDVPQSAATRGDPPVARFLAPLGSITVTAWPDTYSDGKSEVEVLASLQRVTISVRREQYVRVVFKQGTAVIPVDPGSMEFLVLDPSGKNHQIGWAKEAETGALKLILDEPGDYTVRFPKLAGFRALDDRPVRVAYGDTAEVEALLVLE